MVDYHVKSLRLLLHCLVFAVAAAASPFDEFNSFLRAFDQDASLDALDRIVAQAESEQSSFAAQWEAGEASRKLAAQLRDTAALESTRSGERKRMMKLQVSLAKRGGPYAERALALAADEAETVRAHRTLGELAALEINGMISGIRKGPVAESHIEQALSARPDDPENMRASGEMYLFRPAFVGGDVGKAIKLFAACVETDPDSPEYQHLLALAYEMNGDVGEAIALARAVLDINPKHKNARVLLGQLE